MDLEVGTIESEVVAEKKRNLRPGIGKRKGSSGGGKNGGGGGDDGDNGNGEHKDWDYPPFEEAQDFRPDKYRIGMWFLLLVVMMTFGGLIGAYIVISTNGVIEWKPFDLPVQIWVSTVLIILSSIAYEISRF